MHGTDPRPRRSISRGRRPIGSQIVHIVVGTRPEAVKIAPLVDRLRRLGMEVVVVDTGQQPGRVAEALAPFGLRPEVSLPIARRDGGLIELIGLVSAVFDQHLATTGPAAVVVQGDTSTALAVGLVTHLRGVPLVHLEAGLRTHDRENPFPEETNRVLLADLADLHLAPTSRAAASLAAEGHRGDNVVITGNTIVDALHRLLPAARARANASAGHGAHQPHLVVTVHRREAWGSGIQAVADAVRGLVRTHPELWVTVVTHPNPAVAAHVSEQLSGLERCDVLPPQPYDDMLALLTTADVVLTDSGGIQEEAPTIGVPVVIARETTERPEGIDGGWATLAGLDTGRMVAEVARILQSSRAIPTASSPYGDGQAAARAAAAIAWILGTRPRPADWNGHGTEATAGAVA